MFIFKKIVLNTNKCIGRTPCRDAPDFICVFIEGYSGPELYRNEKNQPIIPRFASTREFLEGVNPCTRSQFPLTIPFAITVHKSQGLTMQKAVVDISRPQFTPRSELCGYFRAYCWSRKAIGGIPFVAQLVKHKMQAVENMTILKDMMPSRLVAFDTLHALRRLGLQVWARAMHQASRLARRRQTGWCRKSSLS